MVAEEGDSSLISEAIEMKACCLLPSHTLSEQFTPDGPHAKAPCGMNTVCQKGHRICVSAELASKASGKQVLTWEGETRQVAPARNASSMYCRPSDAARVPASGCHALKTTGLKLSPSRATSDPVIFRGVFGVDRSAAPVVVQVDGVSKAPSSAILDPAVDAVLLRLDNLRLQARRDNKATRPDAKSTALINAKLADDAQLNVPRQLWNGLKYSVCPRSG